LLSGQRQRPPRARAGQRHFSPIIRCSGSRVPVEVRFDQGSGDLFVIRVAGNIID
ncbi:MAG: carbonic anhydrase, partial [Proteobacteria bacterium TMED261]